MNDRLESCLDLMHSVAFVDTRFDIEIRHWEDTRAHDPLSRGSNPKK